MTREEKQRVENIIATLTQCVARLSNYGNLVTGDIIASLKDDIDWFKQIKEGDSYPSSSEIKQLGDPSYCDDCVNYKGCIVCEHGEQKQTLA